MGYCGVLLGIAGYYWVNLEKTCGLRKFYINICNYQEQNVLSKTKIFKVFVTFSKKCKKYF